MAASASLDLRPEAGFSGGLTGIAAAFLLLRAFSSGCAALTGVEAISNGVPAFRKPKSKNAATTLLLLGSIAVTMLISIIVLANMMHLRFAENPGEQLLRNGVPVGNSYTQETVMAQISKAIFGN
jgi:amino acid transporter